MFARSIGSDRVRESLAEHGQPDDVGMGRRMGEGGPTVDPDEDRDVILCWFGNSEPGEVIVLALTFDPLAVEKTPQDLNRSAQAFLATGGRVEYGSAGLVLGEGVTGPDP